jgi:molybdopterin molybdotransferase
MQGSGILTSMSQANCFIILPMDSGAVEPGTLVDVQPFDGLI